MCTTNTYTYVYPDGHKETVQQPSLCSASRHNRPCANNVLFQHPEQFVTYEKPQAKKVFVSQQLPPTPTYTPRASTPNRSGDESDRSHSGSRGKRSSGVYINGQKVIDLEDRHRRHSSSRRERIVLVDNPPTPRTPPQVFTGPHTAPASPNQRISSPYVVNTAPQTRLDQPIFVDERPRVHIEVVDNHKQHKRQSSTSSHESRHSHASNLSRSSDDDEERRRRRRRRREERLREEQEIREQRMRARIAQANAEISKRMPVPVMRRSSTYGPRPTVEMIDHEAQLAEAVRQLEIDQKAQRAAERAAARAERHEEEAQRQRLMERMMPKRRASVGPGSRRPREVYGEGLYRWE
ncbi:hypothetical protein B0I35DRAFT_404744 [Stachybotrys elegans]|uniref:Uncharacterized protein n=1 Tax=Stachybotrys elegans TaxID=80388 RepID=A0A8K0T7J1_9HYPO|nr:hypothetical protein B0I35DRAFT_404744 [Stachybotrys elegans]